MASDREVAGTRIDRNTRLAQHLADARRPNAARVDDGVGRDDGLLGDDRGDAFSIAFEAQNPGIKVKFTPSAPAEYNAVLNSKLEAGSAGDLITCRPFDASLSLYDDGHLAPVQDLDGMKNFSSVAKSGWSTDDGP